MEQSLHINLNPKTLDKIDLHIVLADCVSHVNLAHCNL